VKSEENPAPGGTQRPNRDTFPMPQEFAEDLYSAEGPTLSFHGFPYTTRMAVVRLRDNQLWIWSPAALTVELATEVEGIGGMRHIVSPNILNHLFLREWSRRWPGALLQPPPGVATKAREIRFGGDLGDAPSRFWSEDIDQDLFGGSFAMDEVVFYHRASSTALFGDLIQRFPESTATGWKAAVMRFAGLVGNPGDTPVDWRLTSIRKGVVNSLPRLAPFSLAILTPAD
jgi:hypothetical protein